MAFPCRRRVDAEHARYLLIRQLLEGPHHEDFAVDGWELSNGPAYPFRQLFAIEPLAGG